MNWFEITAPEGYFSINDKLGDIMVNPEGQKVLGQIMAGSTGGAAGFEIDNNEGIKKMIAGFTVKRMISMLGTMGADKQFTKEQMLGLNTTLNQIKK